ncbi:MAG: aldehyde ferredoxin oxidoreductase C-terminal domain-containing protein, partial [Treponema sp.]|nr:aldehyde ferredoxin oxidoreductase C-terminal domain-containing protein [Treponema sp.]
QYRTAVGSPETDEEILMKGERVWNIEKQFNIQAGVEKDTLPPRLLREALPSGAAKGKVTELQVMLDEYYKLRGWEKSGEPSKDKLGALGLK